MSAAATHCLKCTPKYGYNENEFIPEKETKRLDSPGEQFHVR
jgi:hypothetical protein